MKGEGGGESVCAPMFPVDRSRHTQPEREMGETNNEPMVGVGVVPRWHAKEKQGRQRQEGNQEARQRQRKKKASRWGRVGWGGWIACCLACSMEAKCHTVCKGSSGFRGNAGRQAKCHARAGKLFSFLGFLPSVGEGNHTKYTHGPPTFGKPQREGRDQKNTYIHTLFSRVEEKFHHREVIKRQNGPNVRD